MPSREKTPVPWFRASFGPLYERIYGHRDEAEAARQVRQLIGWLNLNPKSRMLDICCGPGRHLAAMQEQGIQGWGVDLSPDLLARASARSGLSGRLVRADVRRLPFGSSFDAAMNLFTSFGYFDDPEDDRQQMQQMSGVLRTGGRLAVDVVNPVHLKKVFQAHSERESDGWHFLETRRLESDRVFKIIQATAPDGTRYDFEESVRLYDVERLKELMAQSGMHKFQAFGDFDGRPHDAHGPRTILIGERK